MFNPENVGSGSTPQDLAFVTGVSEGADMTILLR
jgi:hypothetical protein